MRCGPGRGVNGVVWAGGWARRRRQERGRTVEAGRGQRYAAAASAWVRSSPAGTVRRGARPMSGTAGAHRCATAAVWGWPPPGARPEALPPAATSAGRAGTAVLAGAVAEGRVEPRRQGRGRTVAVAVAVAEGRAEPRRQERGLAVAGAEGRTEQRRQERGLAVAGAEGRTEQRRQERGRTVAVAEGWTEQRGLTVALSAGRAGTEVLLRASKLRYPECRSRLHGRQWQRLMVAGAVRRNEQRRQ
jgi:hypothetical protein